MALVLQATRQVTSSMILALLLDYLSCALWSSRIASDDITTTQTQLCQQKTPCVAKSNLGDRNHDLVRYIVIVREDSERRVINPIE